MLFAREQTRIRLRANACMVATKRAYVGGQAHAFPYANLRKERHFSKLFSHLNYVSLEVLTSPFRVVILRHVNMKNLQTQEPKNSRTMGNNLTIQNLR